MRLVFGFILLGLAGFALSQPVSYPGAIVQTPPLVDGEIIEREWGSAATFTNSYDEETGAPSPFPQKFWLQYDAKFIYIAGRLSDPQPALIRATERRTNVSVRGDDFMVFAVDPFGSLSDQNQFEINPNGATNLKIAGGRAAKREWLGEIFAKGRITGEGWEVEARIPWAILRLPPPGKRDLRIGFARVIARTGRSYISENISGNRETNLGIWKDVDIPASDAQRSIKLLPFAYGGAEDGKGHVANGGLDLKLPLTTSLDLVGTVNPDFRNIENQVLSIDFSYFERLAGESRPFFLEGQNYFGTSRDAPLFASQRIRNFDVGVKTYGKLGENSTIGIMNTVDFGNRNSFAGDLRYNFNDRTQATVAFTDLDQTGTHNQGTFASLGHSSGLYQFYAQHMTTGDTHAGYGHRYNAGTQYSVGGFQSGIEYVEISPDFLPRLGFAPQRNFKGFKGNVELTRPVKLGRIMELGIELSGSVFDRHTGGGLYQRSFEASTSTTFRDGTDLDMGVEFKEFNGFKDRYFYFSLEKPRGDPYRHWQIDLVTGNIAGRTYTSLQPSLSYRPIRNLQLQASYQRVRHFDNEEQTILGANWELSQSDAISGRAIREGSDTNFYLAFRRSGVRGAEYFLILGDPNSRTFRKALVFKASFPLEIRF